MITFWILAAALVVIALVIILPALLRPAREQNSVDRREQNIQIARESLHNLDNEFRRGSLNQEEYDQARAELEISLHEDVATGVEESSRPQKKPAFLSALLITAVLSGGTFYLYQYLGNPHAVTLASTAPAPGSEHSITSMIEQLEARLKKDPDDVEGWLMLGRSYMTEENYSRAEEVYSRLLKDDPENAEVMLLKADALAMMAGGRIGGEPEKLILAALELEPRNFTGLWLAGMVARENGDNEKALQHWYKLREMLPEGSQDLTNLEQLIAQLENPAAASIEQQIPDIDAMVAQLEEKLKTEPENPTGWFMLGRSYMVMKRFPDAATAFEEAHKQNPQDADTKLSLADALAMTNGGKMAGRPAQLVDEALALSPENPKALWLAGMAAREINMNQQAISYWQRLLPLLASDPKSSEEVKSLILQAGGTIPTSDPTSTASTPIADTDGVRALVSISAELLSNTSPDDLVFVYAKAVQGPPMPLAAARRQVRELPLDITLDDSMGMMPQLKMSDHTQWIVGARISKSGQPIAASGDLYAESGPVGPGDRVELLINQIVP